jgi:DNA-binding CsgD family transcriptional regulator
MMLGDMRRKELALGRIKRLASSGLPLEPFVEAVFELVNDAVPNSPHRSFLASVDRSDTYICNTPELQKIVPVHSHFYVESPPALSGTRFRIDTATMRGLSQSKIIWPLDEIALPNFYRSEGFNNVFRPLGFHDCLLVLFQEAGEFVGSYPAWRSADQKPFSSQDLAFLRAVAPHIAHGLKSVRLLARRPHSNDGLVPLVGWGAGFVLLDRRGNLIALDSIARLTFQQIGVFDGLASGTFSRHPVRESLDYITHALSTIFHQAERSSLSIGAPVSQLYVHWTGIALRLRGILLVGADGREYINVLVERGETMESRRRRFIARWGLSQREGGILTLIAESKTGPEIAILLRISHDTVRKHTSRILEKLGVETRTAAAAVALSAASLEGVASGYSPNSARTRQ